MKTFLFFINKNIHDWYTKIMILAHQELKKTYIKQISDDHEYYFKFLLPAFSSFSKIKIKKLMSQSFKLILIHCIEQIE